MYFVSRDGALHDMAGRSFRRFMAGDYGDVLPGVRATVGDFEDHMTTAFTDVRVKRFLEMRGSDAGRPEMMVAQSALWVGLLYDDAALAAADALVRRQPWAAYAALRAAVPRLALDAPFAGGTARDLARDMAATRGLLRALPPRASRRRAFLPWNTPREQGAALRNDGYATLSALADGPDPAGEARRLGCTHILRDGAVVPLTPES